MVRIGYLVKRTGSTLAVLAMLAGPVSFEEPTASVSKNKQPLCWREQLHTYENVHEL